MDGYKTPGLGHNHPAPADLATLLDAEVLGEQLSLDHAALVSRKDKLLEGVERFHDQFKNGITTDEEQGKASDFVRQIKQTAKDADTHRDVAKRPLINAGRTIDAFFKASIVDRLVAAARGIEDVMTSYATEKMLKAQREAAAIRKAAEEEAARVAAAAERTMHPEVIDHAIQAEQAAERARKVEGSGFALSRTRGDLGGVSSLRSRWTFRTVDIMKVPRKYLMLNEKMINAEIRAGLRDGDTPAIDGIEIYDDARVSGR